MQTENKKIAARSDHSERQKESVVTDNHFQNQNIQNRNGRQGLISKIKRRSDCREVLTFYGKTHNGSNLIRCPLSGHEDKNPSFNIYSEGKRFKCHGCGRGGDVINLEAELGGGTNGEAIKRLAKRLGISPNRNKLSRKKKGKAIEYVYTDNAGQPLYKVVRTKNKRFSQHRFELGQWIKGLKNGTTGQLLVKLVPYNLPKVQTAQMVLIVEGEKDVETANKLGLVATCNNGGACNWPDGISHYFEGKDICIVPDNDEAGRKHAHVVANKLWGTAKSIRILELSGLDERADLTDWVNTGHTAEELRQLIDNSQPLKDLPEHAACDNKAELPLIIANNRQLPEIVDDAWQAIKASNQPCPYVFLRNGSLIRIAHNETGPMIQAVDETILIGRLARSAEWIKETQKGTISSFPPPAVARDLLVNPDRSLPELQLIITTPVLGSDWEIISGNGYDPENRVWVDLSIDPDQLKLPKKPTSDDIQKAKELIFDDLLVDFPLYAEADKAHAAAALLLPFVRLSINGCTPLHVVEGPVPGCGKSLYCSLVSIVATGEECAAQSLPTAEEEVRKLITTMLIAGRSLVLLDNADERRKLKSPALLAVLTTRYWTDRILGASRQVILPNNAVWFLTANNLKLESDLARRCVQIRLVPKEDMPWLRTGFKHKDICSWVKKNRILLISAALTLIQNWVARGKPKFQGKPLGSFESYCAVMGGILEAAGIKGFLGNLDRVYEQSDLEGTAWRAFTEAWWEKYEDMEVTVSELNELCDESDLMNDIRLNGKTDQSNKSRQSRLGKALTGIRDRTFGGYRVLKGEVWKGHPVYSLLCVGQAASAESADAVSEPDQARTSANYDFGIVRKSHSLEPKDLQKACEHANYDPTFARKKQSDLDNINLVGGIGNEVRTFAEDNLSPSLPRAATCELGSDGSSHKFAPNEEYPLKIRKILVELPEDLRCDIAERAAIMLDDPQASELEIEQHLRIIIRKRLNSEPQ